MKTGLAKALIAIGLMLVVIVPIAYWSVRNEAAAKKTQAADMSKELFLDHGPVATSSVTDGSVSTWDAETGSLKTYASLEESRRAYDEKWQKDLEEYNKATKGTIVEQVLNIAIPVYVKEGELAQLKQGEIEVRIPKSDEYPDGALSWYAALEKNVRSFAVGDFNKDGLDDVAHVIGYTGGGSGYFYELTIFLNDRGKLKYAAQTELGDRVVIKNVRYESGLIVVDMITQGEGDNFHGMCCPDTPMTIKFKWENNQLIEK